MASRELYDLGEIPPLGEVPRKMHAATIRPERYGRCDGAFGIEVVDVPRVGREQVLVMMMAAGVNYNGVWTARGRPLDVIAHRKKRGEPEDFHIGGSEGSGVVWAVGEDVTGLKVGDPVVISSCRWDRNAPDIRAGADPITSKSTTVWGYEDNYGGFAQFSTVEEYQCFRKPPHLTWEESSCYMVSGATAYRQLLGWPPNTVKPGDPVLIWGGAGGLGSLAIQIARVAGGIPVAVVSSEDKREFCVKLGAGGVVNRRDFHHWGPMPEPEDKEASERWFAQVRGFGKAFWDALGERRLPRIVFEHVGKDTIPTSIFMCDNGGMVVICGATSGWIGDVDFRYLWMRQKRLQGSHFATTPQTEALNQLVYDRRVDPCMSQVFEFRDVGEAHQLIEDNAHLPGNMALLVNAPRAGLRELP
jgi:crotonyl-CoA carboxylase/reductase